MRLAEPELMTRLKASRSVLIAGAGGGFDVYSGLPLYFMLRDAGKDVHLANLSFTHLESVRGERLGGCAVKVTADTEGPDHYFPERALSRWFQARGEAVPIYCFPKVGCRPLNEGYQALQEALGFDTVVLVDGGTDILMRGDECDLGTPAEDLSSVAAVAGMELREKLVVCLGFGVDRHHGVCHAHFLENAAALSREGAFLGTISLLKEMPEVARYLEAVAYSLEEAPEYPSIVCTSIAAAVEGEYGDVHRTYRTRGSTLWINPLMSMYWAFELEAVARRCLYLSWIAETETAFEIALRIEAFRDQVAVRPRLHIPV